MTKKEILSKILEKQFGEIEESECWQAMEEYAEQQAIAFYDWLWNENKEWRHESHLKKKPKDIVPYTTKELYQLFLTHQNKQP